MTDAKTFPMPTEHHVALPHFPAVLLFEWQYRDIKIIATTRKQDDNFVVREVTLRHTNGVAPTWYEVLQIRNVFYRRDSKVFMDIPWVADPKNVRIQQITLNEVLGASVENEAEDLISATEKT